MNNKLLAIPATFMRGGTSKGVFFRLEDLPATAQNAGAERDALLLSIIGSPDPYEKQIDGMGCGSSSTSKAVIVSKSNHQDHDVDYLFAQVAIKQAFIDWSGNCGNLTAAVAAFAVHSGYIDSKKIPDNGFVAVKIWQANIKKTIIAHVPITNRQVQELGNFELDGVTFPSAKIDIDFLDPIDSELSLFPTGNCIDILKLPKDLVKSGELPATFINAGIPTIFVKAQDLGFIGTELQDEINNNPRELARLDAIRAYGALQMRLIDSLEQAKIRQHTPKLAFVAPAKDFTASSGKLISNNQVDLLVRAMSMGKLHHAMMGTCAVAIAVAAAIPETIVNQTLDNNLINNQVTFGHPSGLLSVAAEVSKKQQEWYVTKVTMARSARRLMRGEVFASINSKN